MNVTVGILTVSDRCSRGLAADASGPALREVVEREGWRVARYEIVPDERRRIEEALVEWSDRERLSLILTTGGTGLSPRDITPEATRAILDKELPGLAELMRARGMSANPMAALSRAVSGSRRRTLIINLPGSPKGAVESLSAALGLIPHALDMLSGAGHPAAEAGAKTSGHGARHDRS